MAARERKNNYTINDIAEAAGLSSSTVSRVINQSENVSEKTRQKVQKAIDEMGYVPNLIARGLRTQSHMIGVITQDILNPYYIEGIYQIEKTCKQQGYALLSMNADNDPKLESENIYRLLSMQVQGMILLAPMSDGTNDMVQLAKHDTHLVTMEGIVDGVDAVLCDPRRGMETMLTTLVNLGHRKIGLVHHSMRSYPIKMREQVFVELLQEKGIQISSNNFFYGDDFLAQLDHAYRNNTLPTALFALNDSTALAIYRWCKDKGISIPQDLSVVGFDNVQAYEMIVPTLSTINQPLGQMAEIATNLLIKRISENKAQGKYKPEIISVETEFLPKESISKPRE